MAKQQEGEMSGIEGGVDVFPWSAVYPSGLVFAVVATVQKVEVSRTDGDGSEIIICADGTVPSSGWGAGFLAPKFPGENENAQGIWELVFIARVPAKGTTVLIRETPIQATLVAPLPVWAKYIRIIASDSNFSTTDLQILEETNRKTTQFGIKPLRGPDVFPW